MVCACACSMCACVRGVCVRGVCVRECTRGACVRVCVVCVVACVVCAWCVRGVCVGGVCIRARAALRSDACSGGNKKKKCSGCEVRVLYARVLSVGYSMVTTGARVLRGLLTVTVLACGSSKLLGRFHRHSPMVTAGGLCFMAAPLFSNRIAAYSRYFLGI